MSDSPGKTTKAEIIENICIESEISRQVIHNVVNCFLQEIQNSLNQDKVVELRGFGTFEIRTRKGREKARNPKTGEIFPMKTHGVTVFRPGKRLKRTTWTLRD